VRIDLHTHSDVSDGTTAPAQVVQDARAAGLDVVGLTDHDTTAGWAEAEAAALEAGIALVRGIEVSCTHRGRGVHLLVYLPDPTYPPLVESLQLVLDGRDQRTPRILERLREIGVDLDLADVERESSSAAAVGRPHVADALVRRGVVRDRDEAFDRYLSPGRPAYAKRYAAPLVDMLATVACAGGVSVIAHPWGRYGSSSLDEAAFAELQQHGLAGIEADHQDHGPDERAALHAIGRELGLVVTGSSDYHGAGKVGHDLGCNTTAPDQLDRLLALAAESARRAERRTPGVVGWP
jgi:predicted metal-dependent phosphoesterase TrpH